MFALLRYPIMVLSLSVLLTATGHAQESPAAAAVTIATLEQRVAVLEKKLRYVTTFLDADGRPWMNLAGVNLRITNGSGKTDHMNGLGNLLVGYNELRSPAVAGGCDDDCTNVRTGSHNLLVGRYHNYTSYGGFLAGAWNTVSAPHASVSGGSFNHASGVAAAVSGGGENLASGGGASVSGGHRNTATGAAAAATGGWLNTASGDVAVVSGGYFRDADEYIEWVAGHLSQQVPTLQQQAARRALARYERRLLLRGE